MRNLAALLAVSALICVALPGSASAAHLQCGDVVTESTTLDSDLGRAPVTAWLPAPTTSGSTSAGM